MKLKTILLSIMCLLLFQSNSCTNEFKEHEGGLSTEELWWNGLNDTWKELCLRESDHLGNQINTEILNEILSLERFSLDFYPIDENNLKPLEMLVKLQQISAGNTQITDLFALEKLPLLSYLNIPNTAIHDLTPLQNLENLEEIYIQQSQVSDLKPLSKAKNLQVIMFHETAVVSIEPIMNLPKLSIISIDNTKIPQEEIETFRLTHPNCAIHQ